jgi:hypothetical protein
MAREARVVRDDEVMIPYLLQSQYQALSQRSQKLSGRDNHKRDEVVGVRQEKKVAGKS